MFPETKEAYTERAEQLKKEIHAMKMLSKKERSKFLLDTLFVQLNCVKNRIKKLEIQSS